MKLGIMGTALLFASICAWSQVGVKLGLGYATMRGEAPVEKHLDQGIWSPVVGATYHLDFGLLGIQPSAHLLRKGASGSSELGNGAGSIDYGISAWFLDLPVYLAFKPFPGFSLLAGPVANVFLKGTLDGDILHRTLVEDGLDFTERQDGASKNLDREAMNPVNFGVGVGIQYVLPGLPIGCELGYQFGISSMDRDKKPDLGMKTDILMISALYLF